MSKNNLKTHTFKIIEKIKSFYKDIKMSQMGFLIKMYNNFNLKTQ